MASTRFASACVLLHACPRTKPRAWRQERDASERVRVLQIKIDDDGAGGNALFASADIAAGEIIGRIPYNMTLSRFGVTVCLHGQKKSQYPIPQSQQRLRAVCCTGGKL